MGFQIILMRGEQCQVLVKKLPSMSEARKKIKDPEFLKAVMEEHGLTEATLGIVNPRNCFNIRPVTVYESTPCE